MIPLTTTTKSIDGVLRDTARILLDFITPKILLIGDFDEHYALIQSAYQWAKHTELVPIQFESELALIVVNKRALFNQIIARVPNDTVVLIYDEDQVIPVVERNLKQPRLICYLQKISPRYLPGHVRVLLQLRKALVCVDSGTPYLLVSDREKQIVHQLIRTLDTGQSVFVKAPQIDYFFTVFKDTVQMTHYESVCLVEHPDHFDDIAQTKSTTLVLKVKSKAQYMAYQAKPLNEFSVIYIGERDYVTDKNIQRFDLPELGTSEDVFLLSSYYESLKQNLADESHRTRFIQRNTILKQMKKHRSVLTFIEAIRPLFDAHSVKFRNIPIRVFNSNYCEYPLDDLLQQFHDEMKKELLSQTNHSLYTMEMVSGITRSTLMVRYHLR